jgi:hypothetical protein
MGLDVSPVPNGHLRQEVAGRSNQSHHGRQFGPAREWYQSLVEPSQLVHTVYLRHKATPRVKAARPSFPLWLESWNEGFWNILSRDAGASLNVLYVRSAV